MGEQIKKDQVVNEDDSLQRALALVKDFCEERDWDQFHTPENLAVGVTTEAAELLALFRFKTREQVCELLGSSSSRKVVEDELADVFFFLLRFCQMNRIDLLRSLESKLKTNKEKYPISLSRGSNLKYTEF